MHAEPNHPLLQRLASPGWQHPAFAPYWPILRRLARRAWALHGAGSLPDALTFSVAAMQRQVSGTDAGEDDLSSWDAEHWIDLFNQLARWRGLKSAEGRPLRFVAGSEVGAVDYEQSILRHGEIPCKLHGAGARHDFHNGLVWLRFPRLKAACNLLHCQVADSAAGQAAPGRGRGHRRDAITLLDENGAIWPAPVAGWVDALRQRHWQALFVGERPSLLRSPAPVIVGHGLMEKLHRPYKSMTAKLLVSPALPHGLDRAVAAQLQQMAADDSLRPNVFLPLPLQGWPGWDAANADPQFYADTSVFRALRSSPSA